MPTTETTGLACGILAEGKYLVSGPRAESHGDMTQTHRTIAGLWSAYLAGRIDGGEAITATDVALMMVLLKIARTKHGNIQRDDFVDMAGYAAIAGALECTEDASGTLRGGVK